MKRAEQQPLGDIHLYGDVFVKEMLTPKAGTVIPQHSHHYDHLSYVAAGGVRVWRDDVVLGDFHAPSAVRIPAHCKHRFETLFDWTLVLCIHNAHHGEADFHEGQLVHEEHHIVTEEA